MRIRSISILESVWPISLFALFLSENNSTCGFKGLNYTFLAHRKKKHTHTQNMPMLGHP